MVGHHNEPLPAWIPAVRPQAEEWTPGTAQELQLQRLNAMMLSLSPLASLGAAQRHAGCHSGPRGDQFTVLGGPCFLLQIFEAKVTQIRKGGHEDGSESHYF